MLSKFIRYAVRKYCFAIIAFLFVCAYWISAARLPRASLPFPKTLTYILIPLFLWNLFECVRSFKKTVADTNEPEAKKWDWTLNLTGPKVAVTLITLAYIVCLTKIGFVVSTVAYLAGLAYYLGIRKIPALLLFTGVYTAAIYAVFVYWLQVRMPAGLLF